MPLNFGPCPVRHVLALLAFWITGCGLLAAEAAPANESLHDLIARLDTAVFAAFNAGDLDAQLEYFDPSLEFYHDKGGFSGYDEFITNSKRLFAQTDRPTRTIVAGSLEVYPIAGYGAIQVGRHRFCPPGQEEGCGTFKFVHIWKRHGDQWRITRVISYDH